MATQSVEVLIEGGKATAAPPLGPALGPMGVNIGQVVSEINKKTADFKGMQVPVTVTVNTDDRSYTISIGTPPASSLIKKEAGLKAASGNPKADLVADLKIEQIIKIANMKADSLLGANTYNRCREIIGTCQSMGIMVEGKRAYDVLQNMEEFRSKIESGKTELTADELKALEEEKKKLAAELAAKTKEFQAKADAILEKHKNDSRNKLKTRMLDAGIPAAFAEKVLPADPKAK